MCMIWPLHPPSPLPSPPLPPYARCFARGNGRDGGGSPAAPGDDPDSNADYDDADGDGTITIDELELALRAAGKTPTRRQLQHFLREVDKNDDQRIDMDEFIAMLEGENGHGAAAAAGNGAVGGAGAHRSSVHETDMIEAFKVFDKDGNGKISREELQEVMSSLGEELTEQQLQSMIEEADLDGDGEICFNEFRRMMFSV
ncbi:hypothetical protein AMATHDRAFT_67515 [Amanita thiersii Skay4041]|uniref:EF-hand domain-containing protein n=1 Tax=Amanita thiersii Skay4041 TaxID=703135 RepID=A0A2A9N9E4_9AGAR|nr:hypothetical protein AMATHDRAFT_67515 [Amanita thiersii Skay4041]